MSSSIECPQRHQNRGEGQLSPMVDGLQGIGIKGIIFVASIVRTCLRINEQEKYPDENPDSILVLRN
jgi:hypothetical protein